MFSTYRIVLYCFIAFIDERQKWVEIFAFLLMLKPCLVENTPGPLSDKLSEVSASDVTHEMKGVMMGFVVMWENCFLAGQNHKFKTDDLRSYLSYPTRTTVGVAPRYTKNRRFFANLIATKEFHQTVENDLEVLREDLVKKMEYCKDAIMDKKVLDLYYLDSDWSQLQDL